MDKLPAYPVRQRIYRRINNIGRNAYGAPAKPCAILKLNQHTGHRSGAAGLLAWRQNPHLVIDQLDIGQLGINLDQRLADSGINRINRAVPDRYLVMGIAIDDNRGSGF